MRTPQKYLNDFKQGIITKEMLTFCLFSSNKRAKNCRDKIREYKKTLKSSYYLYDKYNYLDNYTEKMKMYYFQKETMLSIVEPTCIHKEFAGYGRIRIFDYGEDDYDKYLESGQFVWQNSYFDNNIGREVYFGDIEDKSKPKYRWYIFYDFKNGYSFHSPIEEKDISTKFKDLDIVEIDTLDTHGKDISELASTNFVNKIVDLIRNGNYQYVD